MTTQEKPGPKSQRELVLNEEERQKTIEEILKATQVVKEVAMGTDNIPKLRFLKERLYQVAQTGNLHDVLDGKKIANREAVKRYYEKNKAEIISRRARKRRKAREANVCKVQVPAGMQNI